jgi:hypothetical protein
MICRTCRLAMHRPGSGPDSERVAERPGEIASVPCSSPPLGPPKPGNSPKPGITRTRGFGRIDVSGRVGDRAIVGVLGWRPGDRLTLTAAAGVVIARRDPGGLVTMPAKPYLTIPAALRHRCGLRPGDRRAVPEARLTVIDEHIFPGSRRSGALCDRREASHTRRPPDPSGSHRAAGGAVSITWMEGTRGPPHGRLWSRPCAVTQGRQHRAAPPRPESEGYSST